MLGLNVILFLALHLLPRVKSSMVKLNNNGYDGIVIAINPSLPEDEKLIQNIKVRKKILLLTYFYFNKYFQLMLPRHITHICTVLTFQNCFDSIYYLYSMYLTVKINICLKYNLLY